MQKEINSALCPITFGMPTKMTEKGFKRFCSEMQQEISRAYKSATNGRTCNGACRACKGKHKPIELEIMTLTEIAAGMTEQPLNQIK